MPKKVNMTGQRFGRWTVVADAGTNPTTKRSLWSCVCDCGTERLLTRYELASGRSKSCGCNAAKARAEANTKHGLGGTRIYKIWWGVVDRCSNPKSSDYPNYGGRGITVCDRWLSVSNFYADMGEPPSGLHTIDRINNDEGYSPDNCRWADPVEQANNRRTNTLLTLDEKTMNAIQWCRELGINETTLHSRLGKGWSVEKSLTTPVRAKQ